MIEIPTKCPSCHVKLIRVKDQLFCENPLCGDRLRKVIRGFAQKVKLKGLGEKTIEKLNLRSIQELYELEEETLVENIGEKLGKKLIKEIEKAKSMSLGTFLSASSIYLIGSSAGKKIDALTNNPNELTYETLKKIGLGDVASKSLVKWLEEEYSIMNIPITFEKIEAVEEKATKMKVCISGKLVGYTKAEATEKLKQYGIEVVSTVNTADALLVGAYKAKTAKHQQAEKQNKTIYNSVDELIDNIGE